MYLHYTGIYQDVVQEHKDKSIKVIREDIVHHIHELKRGIGNIKGITKNSYNPQRVLNAIFGMPCSRTGIR